MAALEMFPARSRLMCCGTCEAWQERRHPETRKSEAYCPRLGVYLYDNMETIGCALWKMEPRETLALELYGILVKEGAT